MPEPITIIGFTAGTATIVSQLARRYFEIAKDCFDVLLGGVAFVLALPVLVVCGIIIKLSSKGPLFFTQVRLGKDGVPFKMYKLRTMFSDAERLEGAVWAAKNDPRIVPGCRWMRRSHVDELPQLVNVMKGEMSLVGPRPERPEIFVELEKKYPEVRQRLAVKPGITGLAQIRNGYDTNIEAFRDKLNSDLEYIANRKWSNELWIITQTISKFNDKQAC